MLKYLFDLYGKVLSEEVKQKETKIRSIIFNPADPMILLFNPIEKLRKIADSAEITYTDNQILDIGLTVIRNTRDFEKALGDWEVLPAPRKPGPDLKRILKTPNNTSRQSDGPPCTRRDIITQITSRNNCVPTFNNKITIF